MIIMIIIIIFITILLMQFTAAVRSVRCACLWPVELKDAGSAKVLPTFARRTVKLLHGFVCSPSYLELVLLGQLAAFTVTVAKVKHAHKRN